MIFLAVATGPAKFIQDVICPIAGNCIKYTAMPIIFRQIYILYYHGLILHYFFPRNRNTVTVHLGYPKTKNVFRVVVNVIDYTLYMLDKMVFVFD